MIDIRLSLADLSDRRDVVTLIEGIKHASRLVIGDGSPLSDFASFTQAHPKLWPHIDRGTDIIADDSILEELVRDFASTLYHPSSTCRIGDVVDPTLRVKGTATSTSSTSLWAFPPQLSALYRPMRAV